MAIVNGHTLGLEVKSAGKKPTALQVICMRDIERAGGKCFVVDGEEKIKEVEKWIHQKILCSPTEPFSMSETI